MSCVQVSSGLVSRVATADENFNKEMELAPRVSPEFELTLDNTPAVHAIQSMSFFHLKGEFCSMFTEIIYWLANVFFYMVNIQW